MNNIKKQINHDCRKALFPTWIFSVISEIITFLIMIFSADKVADLCNSLFDKNIRLSRESVITLIICQAVNIIIIPVIEYVSNVLMLKYSLKHDRVIYSRFLDKKYDDIKKMDVNTVQSRMEDDIIEFRNTWIYNEIYKYSAPICAVILLVCMSDINYIYIIITLILTISRATVTYRFRKRMAKLKRNELEFTEAYRQDELLAINSCDFIKNIGAEATLIERLREQFDKYYADVKDNLIKTTVNNDTINELVKNIVTVLVILTGCILASLKLITVGEILAMTGYVYAMDFIIRRIINVTQYAPELKELVERIEIFYQNPQTDVRSADMNNNMLELTDVYVEADNTRIPKEPFNAVIDTTVKTILAGENGCGKSTIAKVIGGLYVDYYGRFNMSGGKRIYYSEQTPYLFNVSVRENIELINNIIMENVTDENKIADIESNNRKRIMQLAKEYDITQLLDKQVSGLTDYDMSGGEIQKVGLIRAIIALENGIYTIFDEPTNNLDKKSVAHFAEYVKNSNYGMLIISHNSDIIEECGDVVCAM